MFLHLGEDFIVPKATVIGIFDLQKCSSSIASREFLEIAHSEKNVITIGDKKKIKTFVLTKEGIYLSPISSITLLKRSKEIFAINSIED